MATFAFSGAVAAVKGAGQKNKIRFGGTWAINDTWTAQFTSQLSGEFTLGKGNVSGKAFNVALTYKSRVIVGYTSGFAISAIGHADQWEEQNVGAATFTFSTLYGFQDTVNGLTVLGGSLYVFGGKTIQKWSTDADPTKWTFTQVLANAGTSFPKSIQSIGEVDALYVDYTGVRSIRTKDLSGDAFLSDIGTPIDSLVSSSASSAITNSTPVASGVYPVNKNYFVWVHDTGYWLAQFPISEITAWSTFDLRYSETAANTPSGHTFDGSGADTWIAGLTVGATYHYIKGSNTTSATCNGVVLENNVNFVAGSDTVVFAGTAGQNVTDEFWRVYSTVTPTHFDLGTTSVYVFTTDKQIFTLQSTNDYSECTVETPFLEIANGKMVQLGAIEALMSGCWQVYYKTHPRQSSYTLAYKSSEDSTFQATSTRDLRRISLSGNCSSIQLKFVSSSPNAKLASAAVIYNLSNEK